MPLGNPLNRKPPKLGPKKASFILKPPDPKVLGTIDKRIGRTPINAPAGGRSNQYRVPPKKNDPTDPDHLAVANPYGSSLTAFEPATQIYQKRYDPGSDNPILKGYDSAFNAVQESRYEESLHNAQVVQQGQKLAQVAQFRASQASIPSSVPFADTFNKAAAQYGISPALLAAVARAESNYNPNARSGAGALGLMQFMPGTARGMGINPLDPTQAIYGAARYLRTQIDAFGSVDLALAAYNAGPGNVRKYGGIPPFRETQTYVGRVKDYMAAWPGGQLSAAAPQGEMLTGGTAANVVNAAKSLLGKPYIWGGVSANGVDCSGLLFYAFNAAGVKMPRYRAIDYGHLGTEVSMQDARAGDIVYWDNPNTTTDHVGLYLGDGYVVQAPNSGDHVKISKVWGKPQFRRVLQDGDFGQVATLTGPQTSYAGVEASQIFNRPVSIASPVRLNVMGVTHNGS